MELFTLDSTAPVWKPIRSLALVFTTENFLPFRMVVPRSTSPRSEPFHCEVFVEHWSGVRGHNERASSRREHMVQQGETHQYHVLLAQRSRSPAPYCASLPPGAVEPTGGARPLLPGSCDERMNTPCVFNSHNKYSTECLL